MSYRCCRTARDKTCGSVHSDEIVTACREHGITLARTGLRLFHH